jgi:HSP20 family protein
MLGYWSALERNFSDRRVGHAFREEAATAANNWPRTSVYDAGSKLVVRADLPGVKDKDLEVTLEKDVLTLAGERHLALPEGHIVHRQERRSARFSRKFLLPCKVDAEALAAELKDGVLTITLPKAPEAQARKIAVKAG